MAAAQEALEHAGWDDGPPYEPDVVGCVIGTGIGGLGTIEDAHDVLRDNGPGRVSPLTVPLMMANAGSAALAMRHGLQGPVYGVVSACAAGAHAIGAGMRMIQTGDADAAVVGGSEAALTSLASAAFAAMDATSTSGISRPFDARRDGFVMGEGAGVLVLEALDTAEARGARLVGELRGYAATADAHHLTAPEPDGRGAARAIERALADADVRPEQLDYVNAHGTSTPLNDRAETVALKSALGRERRRRAGVVHQVGHRPPARRRRRRGGGGDRAGAERARGAAHARLRRGGRRARPGLRAGQRPAADDATAIAPRSAISNSFGFGGHNAVLCLAGAS